MKQYGRMKGEMKPMMMTGMIKRMTHLDDSRYEVMKAEKKTKMIK